MIKDRVSLKGDLECLLVTCLRDLSAQQDLELAADLGSATRLFGDGGVLDSLALLALVVAMERAIEDEFGIGVSLADERALSQRPSPYRTIGSLADYAGALIEEGT